MGRSKAPSLPIKALSFCRPTELREERWYAVPKGGDGASRQTIDDRRGRDLRFEDVETIRQETSDGQTVRQSDFRRALRAFGGAFYDSRRPPSCRLGFLGELVD